MADCYVSVAVGAGKLSQTKALQRKLARVAQGVAEVPLPAHVGLLLVQHEVSCANLVGGRREQQ